MLVLSQYSPQNNNPFDSSIHRLAWPVLEFHHNGVIVWLQSFGSGIGGMGFGWAK